MNLLDKVKERLEITDTSQDKKIQSYIDEIIDKVKSICNRVDYPEELNYLAIKYAKDSFIYYKNKDNSINEQMQLMSASDNGQTVNFKIIENVSKDDVDLDKVIAKNMEEISNYAYMRW
ncbi:MAG: phage head-tail connector protein [Clostridia bacterium]|nr:phage head-tail connector protein [Clostridia bacterium]